MRLDGSHGLPTPCGSAVPRHAAEVGRLHLASARTAAGAPSTSLEPKFITTSRSTSFITKSMSCSTIRIVTPSPRSLRSSSAERLLLLAAQAGGRLVEHQQHRVGGQRARDLEDALGAQRQAAGQLVRAVGQADALELAQRLGADLRFLARGPAAARRRSSPARVRAMRAERDVVEQAHVRPQLDVLEGARHAQPRDVLAATGR